MQQSDDSEITRLLHAWRSGDETALDQLTPVVYEELRRIARNYRRRERPGHSLQTTAIVHETWLRLADTIHPNWEDRAHFFAAASNIIRRILVDKARARITAKRGGAGQRAEHPSPVDLDGIPVAEPSPSLIALDDALNDLARLDLRKARVVELRFFGGLSVEETAIVLEVSPQTVMRDWKLARVWLARELQRPISDRFPGS
jgi:RNA polymerase sigma factor (TIGR02999 family)